MDIRISGHQVETGETRSRTQVAERLQGIADKYFARAISAEVTFGKGPHDSGFKCDIVAHVMRGLVLKGRSRLAAGRPCRLHRRGRQDRDPASPLHAPPQGSQARPRRSPHRRPTATTTPTTPCSPRSTDEEDVGDAPLIIAETRVDVPEATVSDAVMMLDLRNTAALLFRNTGTGSYNMVYRRGDGTIGWVEPQRVQ